MSQYRKDVAEILAGPEGPEIAAFFDFDGTLINGFSVGPHLREQVRAGHINPEELLRLSRGMVSFGLGQMEFSSMMALSAQFLAGLEDRELAEFSQEVHDKYVSKSVYPESRALVEAHLAKGHTVAIISSATQYQVEPAARELNIPHYFSSVLEINDGILSGRVEKPCFGYGKVEAAEVLTEQFNVDLSQSYFYSDGDEDIPLLERVGKPRPLNPNSKLREYGRKRGWPMRKFSSRGRPSIMRAGRTLSAYVSLVASFASGLPILALTGSKSKARNFSMTTFAESASALIGLDLNVVNEHLLWKNRPAVFIFNHQSKADVLIMASLVRRDMVGIGKKEIRNIPIIGAVMEFAGMVMIDRKDTGSAIQAIQPLIDVMHNEGLSVCIAPEGTRSVAKKLGAFKKGAFHIAMQAGVPIVPVVIHNATDSAAKGQFFFSPCTVDVEILEPIDTSNWSAETIDEHVESVRELYLEALGQGPDTSSETASAAKTTTAAKTKTKTTTKTKTAAKTASAASTNKKAAKAPAKKASKAPAKKKSTRKAAADKEPLATSNNAVAE